MRCFTILKIRADIINDTELLTEIVGKEAVKIRKQPLEYPAIDMIVSGYNGDEFVKNIVTVYLLYSTPGTPPICLN